MSTYEMHINNPLRYYRIKLDDNFDNSLIMFDNDRRSYMLNWIWEMPNVKQRWNIPTNRPNTLKLSASKKEGSRSNISKNTTSNVEFLAVRILFRTPISPISDQAVYMTYYVFGPVSGHWPVGWPTQWPNVCFQLVCLDLWACFSHEIILQKSKLFL